MNSVFCAGYTENLLRGLEIPPFLTHKTCAQAKGLGMTVTSIEELTENFALFDDWEERYRYLIDIGRGLPHMDDVLKTDAHLVRGCTSRVWLVPSIQNDVLSFQADSDAHIVRGLVALLFSAYQNKPLSEVRALDIDEVFKRIGLDTHLSANRRSGFYAMVEKIKALAA